MRLFLDSVCFTVRHFVPVTNKPISAAVPQLLISSLKPVRLFGDSDESLEYLPLVGGEFVQDRVRDGRCDES